MGFPRQEYWSGLSFQGSSLTQGLNLCPHVPCIAGRFFTAEPPGKPLRHNNCATDVHWMQPVRTERAKMQTYSVKNANTLKCTHTQNSNTNSVWTYPYGSKTFWLSSHLFLAQVCPYPFDQVPERLGAWDDIEGGRKGTSFFKITHPKLCSSKFPFYIRMVLNRRKWQVLTGFLIRWDKPYREPVAWLWSGSWNVN